MPQREPPERARVSRIPVRVRFVETDAMGVVHHSAYVPYLEAARVEHLRRHGLLYRELAEAGTHLAVVELEVRYRAPARFDDALVVEVWVERLARASVWLAYRIRREAVVLVEARTRLACVDAGGRPRPIPGPVRGALDPEASGAGDADPKARPEGDGQAP